MSRRLPTATTLLLIGLTVLVQVAAVWAVAEPLQAVEAPAPVETAQNDPGTAVPILLVISVEMVVVWLGYAAYQRLPEGVQRWVKRGVVGAAILYAIVYAIAIMPLLLAVYATAAVAYALDYEWVSYNLLALVLAIVVAATLGGYFGPLPVVVLVGVLIGYDHLAVLESDVMADMVGLLSSLRLPVMVIIPTDPDFDLTAFLDALGEGEHAGEWTDRIQTAVGVGDFALPAALTAAVFRLHPPAFAFAVLLGTVYGMLLLGNKLGSEGALPGLPWLGGGALAGYAVALIVVAF